MKTNDLTHTPRERTSVFITGVDTSTPDDLVKDGMCEELHNMRYESSAWRPVHGHAQKVNMNAPRDVVYHHPAAGENTYVTLQRQGPNYAYYSMTFDSTSAAAPMKLIASFTTEQRISHFGNVLIFHSDIDIHYYFFRNPNYVAFTFPDAPSIKSLTKSLYRISPSKYIDDSGSWKDYDENDVSANVRKVVFPIANMKTHEPLIPMFSPSTEADEMQAWHGEVAFFVAYRMIDGTILSPSMMQILASEKYIKNNSRYLTTGVYGEEDRYIAIEHHSSMAPYEDSAMQYVKGEAIYTIPNNINPDIIDSVVCFATRINSIFDYSKIIDNSQLNSGIYSAFANNDLPNQPFYLMQEKAIKGQDFVIFNLNRENLENIEVNSKYVPDNNVHIFKAQTWLDYNNRLHIADVKTIFFNGYNIKEFVSPSSEADLGAYDVAVSLDVAGLSYYAKRKSELTSIPPSPFPAPCIITYPDFRAKRYIFQYNEDLSSQFSLMPAPANNVAYFINKPTSELKYPPVVLSWADSFINIPDTNVAYQPNRIQVSATNNCFSFPFENSYTIGGATNRILALQSAAIEMHEMKVGELPLYAFTEEGIFALVAGAETLYASVAAINYDKIINPNTLAINGAIVYITEKGVHLLTTSGTQIISTPIHGANGMPPLDFLRTCKILWPKQYNDIVLFNDAYSKAYVYNLDAGYWSTRDLAGHKINTDELVNGQYILNLADEDESKALQCSITTRPIKLGDVEFKRLETIIPRMATNDELVVIDMKVDGSVDGYSYSELRKVAMELEPHRINPLTLRRTPFSAKYFKCHILMEPELGESFNPSITHIDFEWYRKLRHRMR